ncbi:FAD-dependent monooxygenase sdcF [Fulvia fulva]|uniref:FAD-dependent monooxygenase sdcF n=1 Tax=Passalora fulva TaxID=5499 RepID=A0A9Q8PJN6_PASFU|nr:FAD-dependent monooxygenase sdcF [Fulvia fulva]KAK4611895.1 FAD-dependent monooxygenase sdcF [Fulvia fulva]UJO23642.1 FAD-dependent monooxygenase sdcF [Fulvia fulva]WPV21495.1 FAD-dependent monooxygenase sdcF [Fulvia fulva]WPV35918.1 FAD-dependent monooxygenase sdcF [Fulvia fulva]
MRDLTAIAAVLFLLPGSFALQKHLQGNDCCNVLREAGVGNIFLPQSKNYTERVHSYWSLTSQLEPNCFVLPGNAEEVSTIVKTLVEKTKCEFAVRSGGHSSNAGYNNILNGVTIDLSRINSTTYNNATQIASVGPGARWLGVYRTMDALDRGIQGGAIGTVGVGGLLLGGGFANYAYQRGLATDDIVNFEVVLANGSIVQANATHNQDLWRTLKGGGSGFGIVTRYDMYTFERPLMWSSYREFSASEELDEAHIRGLKHWTDNEEAYKSGAAYVWWTYRPADNDTILIAMVGDTSGQANPPAAQEFLNISGAKTESGGLTNMSQEALATQAEGYRNIWWTLTLKNEEHAIRKAVHLHHQLVSEMLRDSVNLDFETQAYFQPLPIIMAQRAAEKGGNTLGLDRIGNNSVILLASLAVNGVDQEALGRQKMYAWLRALEQYTEATGTMVEYKYMNYADATQDVLKSYGRENVKRMQRVSSKYDPEGVFQTRAPGGFKLPWGFE